MNISNKLQYNRAYIFCEKFYKYNLLAQYDHVFKLANDPFYVK